MFEPENDLELALVEATEDLSRRDSFLRRLLDAEVFVAFSVDRELEAKPDGTATVPLGAHLTERIVTRDGETLIPFFSTEARARTIFKDTHVVVPDIARAVLERHPGASFVLNPGSDYGREFPAAEAARLLAGDFSPAVDAVTITKPTQVMLSQPLPYPTGLVEGLNRVFADHPVIQSAHLAQVDYPGNERHPVIGIEIVGSNWRGMMDALRVDLPRAIPDRRVVDFVPCPGGPFDDYFEQIEPFYRRGEPATGRRRWFSRRA